jgi:hypothetical protein
VQGSFTGTISSGGEVLAGTWVHADRLPLSFKRETSPPEASTPTAQAMPLNWASADPASVSVIDIRPWGGMRFTVGEAYLNGARIRVLLDSGAPLSMLSKHVAAHAGVYYDSPGVVKVDNVTGIDGQVIGSWIAPFDSFRIGHEDRVSPHLRIAAFVLPDIDMLLGAAFFLAHSVYVDNKRKRVYFTYCHREGGG